MTKPPPFTESEIEAAKRAILAQLDKPILDQLRALVAARKAAA